MRKFLIRFTMTVLLLAALFVVSAYAEEATITGNDVNFRSGPGMNYEVTDCLEKGTTVTVIDRSNSQWYSVSYNGKTGFVYASYVSISEAPVSEEVTPAVQAPAQNQEAEQPSAFINAMYVRFRSGPSTDYSILGELNSGTALTVKGTVGSWSFVSVNGQEGYVFSDYITNGTPQIAEPAVQAPASPEPSAPASPQPVVEEAPVTVPVPQTPVTATDEKEGIINADYVRFRTGPGTNYSILSSYNRNQPVKIKGTSGDWSLAVINGQEGYVYTSYVTLKENVKEEPVQEQPAAQAKTGYIKGNTVRFRSAASLNSSILGEYNTGTELTILGTSGDWTKVTIGSKTGFVYSSYITTKAPAVATSGTTQGQKIANYALQFLGCDYVWGGNSPEEGFDCSGLVHYVFGQFGINTHRVACDIAGDGVHVDPDDLQPGDVLCFYSSDNYIGHVGIYIGNGQFVHASTYTTGVIVSELDTSYYANNYEARRIAG